MNSKVRGYGKKGMQEEVNFRMEETMYIRETLLDYSYCWGLSMGKTVEYLAGHNLGIGYKELMVDRVGRWMKDRRDYEQYMSEESASEPSELSR